MTGRAPRIAERRRSPARADALRRSIERLRVLVVGDAVVDVWMHGDCDRVSREAPTPVVEVDRWDHAPGGAANCAANAAALGAQVTYIGIVGPDTAARKLQSALGDRGVDLSRIVVDPAHPTVSKHRIVVDDQVVARFDTGLCGSWSTASLEQAERAFVDAVESADVVLVADYGTGCLAETFPRTVAAVRDRIAGPLVVDGHDFANWCGCRPTAMSPSLSEVARLMGWGDLEDPIEAVSRHSEELLSRCGAEMLLTTMDEHGTLLHLPGDPPHRTHAGRAPRQQTCGAGDTFTTAFALALGAGAPPQVAADLGQCAADVVVSRPGTSTCPAGALFDRWAGPTRSPIIDHDQLAACIEDRRGRGERVVFTNGCFDVLHAGHVQYLQQARDLGDVLVVALNSDSSVRRLKGDTRPVVLEEERAALVAALASVDYVTLFEQDSPARLIELLRPDVYVKGGDYTANMLPEAELVDRVGGEVVTVDYLRDHSTTDLLTRIQEAPVASERAGKPR